jgi:hypothetical protein
MEDTNTTLDNPLEYIEPKEREDVLRFTNARGVHAPPHWHYNPVHVEPLTQQGSYFYRHCSNRFSRRISAHAQLWYFTSAAKAALEIGIWKRFARPLLSTPDDKAYTYTLIDAAIRTHQVVASTWEARLAYIIRYKTKKNFTGGERVAERLAYTECFDKVSSKP